MRCALRMILPIIGAWTLVGLVLGFRNYANFAYAGPGISWSAAFAESFSQAYVWAALTPIIAWLSRRFRLQRGSLARRLPIHLVAALTLGLVHLVAMLQLPKFFPWLPAYAPAAAEVLQNVLVYVSVAAVSHGLQAQGEASDREMKAARLQAELTEARIGLLQAQLQPHFLFNSLHAISELMHEDVDRAETAIADLSYLLRLSLENTGLQKVPLADELEFVERYLDIERVRFEDRLAVKISVPDELLAASVPYLALQPLVENALRHAVSKQRGASRIDIRAERHGDTLRVEVQDTGPGADSVAASRSRPGENRDRDSHANRPSGNGSGSNGKGGGNTGGAGSGVGLSNTRARLRELYGDRQSLELLPAGAGICARLEFPFSLGDARGN